MFLYLKRSMRPTWLGGTVYKLTAFLDATEAELRVIHAHRLTDRLLYVAPLDRVEALERRADLAWERQKKLSPFRHEDTGKILLENAKVVALSLRATYALHTTFRVSVADLVAGVVIEGTLGEVTLCQTSINKGFDIIQKLVEDCISFEQDAETVLEPDAIDDLLVPPSAWPRFSKR